MSKNPPVFVGSGFVAKYPEGGGNFSVVLQFMLGIRRLGRRGIWLETLPTGKTLEQNRQRASVFRRRLESFGLEKDFHLVVCDAEGRPLGPTFGISPRELDQMLSGPNILLNLSYSIRPPLLERFEQRVLWSLDPTEIAFWMQRMEMGQNTHHRFVTIGLNIGRPGCRVPPTSVAWETVFPLVDTATLTSQPRPSRDHFSTVGQWYWDGAVEWDGQWRDFSKKAAFEPYLCLPALMPEARWTLAMNLAPDDPERDRIRAQGWNFVHPHRVARTPRAYYRFLTSSTAEFSAVKLETYARSGWLSDRSAAYMALGRPVITESTGAEPYLPAEPGMLFVSTAEEAREAARRVIRDWSILSQQARATAVECLDAVRNLRKILENSTPSR